MYKYNKYINMVKFIERDWFLIISTETTFLLTMLSIWFWNWLLFISQQDSYWLTQISTWSHITSIDYNLNTAVYSVHHYYTQNS